MPDPTAYIVRTIIRWRNLFGGALISAASILATYGYRWCSGIEGRILACETAVGILSQNVKYTQQSLQMTREDFAHGIATVSSEVQINRQENDQNFRAMMSMLRGARVTVDRQSGVRSN